MKILKAIIIGASTALLLLLAGCETIPENVDTKNDKGHAVMGLDYRDFQKAAIDMTQDLVKSHRLVRTDGSRPYTMATSVITNDTMQRIDTDQLMVKIKEELINSGQVTMTAATGYGTAVDPLIKDARSARQDAEYNQSTVAAQNTLNYPDLSISGKIIQRDVRYERDTTQVEYYFQLQIADMRTGNVFWIKEVQIAKRGDSKSVSW